MVTNKFDESSLSFANAFSNVREACKYIDKVYYTDTSPAVFRRILGGPGT